MNWIVRGMKGILLAGGALTCTMLYAAFHVASRPLVLVVVGASKIVFMALVLTYGRAFVAKAAVPLVVDGVLVLLFALYLAADKKA